MLLDCPMADAEPCGDFFTGKPENKQIADVPLLLGKRTGLRSASIARAISGSAPVHADRLLGKG
jgi:hypothetical protein